MKYCKSRVRYAASHPTGHGAIQVYVSCKRCQARSSKDTKGAKLREQRSAGFWWQAAHTSSDEKEKIKRKLSTRLAMAIKVGLKGVVNSGSRPFVA